MRMRFALAAALGVTVAASALAQSPGTRSAAGTVPAAGTRAAATAPGRVAIKSIDAALQMPVKVAPMTLGDLSRHLADSSQANLAFNWNALGKAGVTRDTPVTLYLRDATLEATLRALADVLPAADAGGRANYTIDENALELTTNGELGKGSSVTQFYNVLHVSSYTLSTTPSGGWAAVTAAERDENLKLVEKIARAELRRAGEPLDDKIHLLVTRETTLAATLSDRGQHVLDRTISLLNTPAKPGQLVAGTQLTPSARKAQDALKAAIPVPRTLTGKEYVDLAKNPLKYGDRLNIGVLPGTEEELRKDMPAIGAAVTDGGIVLVGPRAALAQRTMLAAYDIRDLAKKIVAKNPRKPTLLECQSAIVGFLQQELKPDGAPFGTLDDLARTPAPPSLLFPYNGILVVFATQETQRTVAGALQDMNK